MTGIKIKRKNGKSLMGPKAKKILKKIEESGRIFLDEIWLPVALFLIMFIGWLQKNFNYETTFIEDISTSFSLLFSTFLNIGAEKISGFAFLVLFILFIFTGIWKIINVWSKKSK